MTSTFFVVVDQDFSNTYLTYAGGISVLFSLLVLVGGGVFPGYYVFLRSSLDAQLTKAELVASCALLVPWLALASTMVAVAPSLSSVWAPYVARVLGAMDVAALLTIGVLLVMTWRSLRGVNAAVVRVVPGSAAFHNDL